MWTQRIKHIGGSFLALAFCFAMIQGCTSEAPCECIRSYGKTNMSSDDIKRLLNEGVTGCFDHSDPDDLAEDGECLPTVVGTDARNGKSIRIGYTCSDVCPDAGGIIVAYDGVDEAECCAIGAVVARDPAWGGYVGCMPPEVGWTSQGTCP